MVVIANVYRKELPEIKKQVENAFDYFKGNRQKFNDLRKFVLQSTLTPRDRASLQELDKPQLQFNILEAYGSRLLGEFAKQEPSLEVHSAPTANPPDADTVDVVEGHLRSIFSEFEQYEVYRDQITGGYSVIKLSYDYENPNSFEHKIYVERAYDPLLTFFDPIARKKHKGDGDMCGEFYPKTKTDLEEMYPNLDLKDISATIDGEGLKWHYKIGQEDVYLLCEVYKKKKKRVRINRLADGTIKTDAEYEKMLQHYKDKMIVAQPPVIVQSRRTMRTVIVCYRFIGDQMLEAYETDFSILPLIFVDGNSVTIREEKENSQNKQIVKSYFENAIDAQRLKNIGGQQLADGIESMVMHKMKIAMESVPPEYLDLYTSPQYAGHYVYKAYDDNDRPLPAPTEVIKVPLPPEIMGAFTGADQLVQNILGSYDASLGINNNQLSGIAIQEGATQSNATAMPYISNLLESYQQLANGILDLIPKLYVTPRSIPILTSENKRAFALINTQNVPQDGKRYKNTKPIKISYNSSDLKVIVKPGVNFEVQQQKALDVTMQLAKFLPSFAAILNGPGLPILFENLNIRGADRWRKLAEDQVEQQKQMQMRQQQMQQQGQMPQYNPELQKIALEQQKTVLTNQEKQAEIQLKQQQLEMQRVKISADMIANKQDNQVQLAKTQTEKEVNAADLALRVHDQLHRHQSDMIEHAKDIHNMAQDRINNETDSNSLGT